MVSKYFVVGSLIFLFFYIAGRAEVLYPSLGRQDADRCRGVKISKLPELVVFEKGDRKEGVSAAFGGTLKDAVVVAGGCNFPDIPAADGGKKVYYDQIYVLRNPGRRKVSWEVAGRLPVSVANGASVTLPEGIVCIGGCNQDKALNHVWLLNWGPGHAAIITKDLPDLPVAMDNLAAATDGKNIYVAGGNINGMPGKRSFVLKGLDAQEWCELPVYPGAVRLQPVAVVVKQKFYLMGGFQPVTGDQESVVATDGLVYNPADGKWSEAGEIMPEDGKGPQGLVGAAGLVLEDEVMVFQGGVDYAVFKAAIDNALLQRQAAGSGQQDEEERLKQEQSMYMRHEPDWYGFSRRLLLFRPESGEWTGFGDWEEIARVGAVVVWYKNKLVVVNGETKPGIRSAGACMLDWKY